MSKQLIEQRESRVDAGCRMMVEDTVVTSAGKNLRVNYWREVGAEAGNSGNVVHVPSNVPSNVFMHLLPAVLSDLSS